MPVVFKPVLTEKSAPGMEHGQYVLAVSGLATKTQIKQELKQMFNVDVISVRIVNLPAKSVNWKRRPGLRASRTKAYVQLKDKQVLPGFELPKNKNKKEKDAESS